MEQLAEKGWHIKVMTDHSGPEMAWRAWVSWRRGAQPHKEESTKQSDLAAIAAWVQSTVAGWVFE